MRARRAALQIVASLLLLAGTAEATWLRAETEKFVVYSDGSERSLRDFATQLTRFDAVLRRFHPATAKRTPTTKVHVFLVSDAELRRVFPDKPYVGGLYVTTPAGVFALAQEHSGLGTDEVLFHEYAHHFMRENFPAAYPAWFTEGWAEYFMTTKIDGETVRVGGYNENRVQALYAGADVSMEELLAGNVQDMGPNQSSVFYLRAWQLMHYMRSDPKRAKQLDAAIRAIAGGADPVQAVTKATGMTTTKLRDVLRGYKSFPVFKLTVPEGRPIAMKVTTLPPSANDLLLDELRLLIGLVDATDTVFLASVRTKAAKHPGDPLAERTLARAEFVAGNTAAGETIMTRRLAAKPDDVEDLLLASYGQILAGKDLPADQRRARYKKARAYLIKAYARAKADFRVLYAYALSRSLEPTYPNENDLKALIEARDLAPAVQENAFRAGVALLQAGRRADAEKMLRPLVNDPHAGEMAKQARQALDAASGGAKPTGHQHQAH